jgi:hypothetical protein
MDLGEASWNECGQPKMELKKTLARTCWRLNLYKSIYKLSPGREIKEEPGGEELNIWSGWEGELLVGESEGRQPQ